MRALLRVAASFAVAMPVGLPSCSVLDGWFPNERPPRVYSASRVEPSDFATVLPTKPREPEPPPAPAAPDPSEPSSDSTKRESAKGDAAKSDGAKNGEAADPEPVLVSTAKETVVYSRPTTKSPKLGYLRAGAIVTRADKPASFDGCRGGFYEIGPEGYVCAGPAATLSRDDLSRAVPRRADRAAPLPYVYGLASPAGSPLYSRIPSDAEQRAAEPDLASHLAHGGATSFDAASLDDVPWFLENGAPSIRTNGRRFSAASAELRRAIPRTGFAFMSLFESGHRRFGLTSDMAIVPLDRFTRVEPSRFHGIPLGDADGLPVVFVRSKSAALYAGDPKTKGLTFDRRLEFREAVPITGKRVDVSGTAYLETRAGEWLVDQNVVRVDPPASLPGWAEGTRTWIDVSILKQSLVAYVGTHPVFVTLVSTGADGTGDPETTHSTIQGQFLIHTKHVTVTMDNDEVGDEFDLRDVPYVQYFKDGYALHAAYWHDGFGTPHSHGCVNLAPLDARFLFAWTEPPVPMAWHGAMSTHGTLVSIHP